MTEILDETNSLWLRIVTPERVMLEVRVYWAQVPTIDGLLGIWPMHTALADVVSAGYVQYETADGVHREWVDGGILHVRQGQVIVMTEGRLAEPPPEELEAAPAEIAKGGPAEAPLPIETVEAWDESVKEVERVLGELERKEEPPDEEASG